MLPVSLRSHLALDLGLGGERGDRIDHDHVHRAGTHQHVGDLQRLFAGVGLRDEQVLGLDPELGGIGNIERVLRVDKSGGAADFLHLGDHLEGQRRLARGFRAVDFHHPAARQAADAQRDVQAERTGGHHVDILDRGVVHLHDGALAVLLFDLRQRRFERLLSVVVHLYVPLFIGCRHLRQDARNLRLGRHRILYKCTCIVVG